MSYGTQTSTSTYTKVDIRRVFEAVEAALRMAVSRTGLNSAEWAAIMAHDLRHMAQSGALSRAHLILRDVLEREVRALVFTPTDTAFGWSDERPKANHWPTLPFGSLQIVVQRTPAFYALTVAQQAQIMAGCRLNWNDTSIDVSHAGLPVVRCQRHASNAYGVETVDYGQ